MEYENKGNEIRKTTKKIYRSEECRESKKYKRIKKKYIA